MTPAELWNACLQAAAKLSLVPCSSIFLSGLESTECLRKMASFAEAPVESLPHIVLGRPTVIEHFSSLVGECRVTVQASRPATEDESRDATAEK